MTGLLAGKVRRGSGLLEQRGLAIPAVVACLVLLLGLGAGAPAVSAAPDASITIDANSGSILHEENADSPRFPASLTKMMTLYVVFEMLEKGRLDLDADLIITERAANAQPSKLGLDAGERIRLSDAIKALVTKSANDIAISIAENLAGTEDKFARYMTRKAREIGMKSTTFKNASGLPNPAQTTTARDLLTLSLRLQDDFPQYYPYFKTETFTYRGKRHRNHNSLLFSYEGTDGIKTGYTRASGFNLAASVHRDGKHVVGVVLGGETSRTRNATMRRLMTSALAKASTEKTRKPSRRKDPEIASAKAKAKPAKVAAPAQPEQEAAVTELAPNKKQSLGASALSQGEDAAAFVTTTTSAATAPQQPAALADSVAPARPAGPYQIQVGAFANQSEAFDRLTKVSVTAASLLAGHEAVTLEFSKNNRIWYRARFAGFEEPKAKLTCTNLKKQKIDCLVLPAQ